MKRYKFKDFMKWYKKSQSHLRFDYPYSLLETIKMHGDKGLSLKAMDFQELQEAKDYLEPSGFIIKKVIEDENGKNSVYVINKEKSQEMGWKTAMNEGPIYNGRLI